MADDTDNDQKVHVGSDEPASTTDMSAVNLIRQKVAKLYGSEPNFEDELIESEAALKPSKHQKYMQELNSSGLDLAEIQVKWHEYYGSLPEEEKHEVWQEFYDSQSTITQQKLEDKSEDALAKNKEQIISSPRRKAGSTAKQTRRAPAKLTAKHHLQSVLFGLGVGSITIFIFLFSFFNEVIIAPFIQPSRASSSTPIILSTDQIAPTQTPEVIIPKINVQIPVNYSVNTTDENVIESDLEDGVIHYPTTVLPGQDGNAAFFGHSSNNIFNPGKYKFAFVLLHTLVPGDTFYLTYNSKVYVYKVISRTIVPPSDVSVLGPVANQTATATLITCDPPGTSNNRLIVVGQQISPDISTNTAAVASSVTPSKTLPSNGPTLLSRAMGTFLGKLVALIVVVVLIGFGYYRLKIAWNN